MDKCDINVEIWEDGVLKRKYLYFDGKYVVNINGKDNWIKCLTREQVNQSLHKGVERWKNYKNN